jgi:hypothetical protein
MNCFNNSKQGLTPQTPLKWRFIDSRLISFFLANCYSQSFYRNLANTRYLHVVAYAL